MARSFGDFLTSLNEVRHSAISDLGIWVGTVATKRRMVD